MPYLSIYKDNILVLGLDLAGTNDEDRDRNSPHYRSSEHVTFKSHQTGIILLTTAITNDVTRNTTTTHFPITDDIDKYDTERELSVMIEKIWEAGKNKYMEAGKEYMIKYQGKTTPTDIEDRAPKR